MKDQILQSVVFLGFFNKATNNFESRGTGFVVDTATKFDGANVGRVAICTAAHVIDALIAKGIEQIIVRFSSDDGGSFWRSTLAEDWVKSFDPSVDTAIYLAAFPARTKHLGIPISMLCGLEDANSFSLQLGDTVFFPGLFFPHPGETTMTPILRTGAVSRLADHEGISAVKPDGELVRGISAHLIEARSVGGFSGSPVFYLATPIDALTKRVTKSGPHVFLVGLVSGHFPVTEATLVDSETNIAQPRILNSGITYVTPSSYLSELIKTIAATDSKQRLFYPVSNSEANIQFMHKLNDMGYAGIKDFLENREGDQFHYYQFLHAGSYFCQLFDGSDTDDDNAIKKLFSILTAIMESEEFRRHGRFVYGEETFEKLAQALSEGHQMFSQLFIELHGKNLERLADVLSSKN